MLHLRARGTQRVSGLLKDFMKSGGRAGLGGLECGRKPRHRHLREELHRRLRYKGEVPNLLPYLRILHLRSRQHLFWRRLDHGDDQRHNLIRSRALALEPLELRFLVFAAPLPESISKGKVDLLTLHHDHCLLDCSGGIRKWGGAPGGAVDISIPTFRSRLSTAHLCALPSSGGVSAPGR